MECFADGSSAVVAAVSTEDDSSRARGASSNSMSGAAEISSLISVPAGVSDVSVKSSVAHSSRDAAATCNEDLPHILEERESANSASGVRMRGRTGCGVTSPRVVDCISTSSFGTTSALDVDSKGKKPMHSTTSVPTTTFSCAAVCAQETETTCNADIDSKGVGGTSHDTTVLLSTGFALGQSASQPVPPTARKGSGGEMPSKLAIASLKRTAGTDEQTPTETANSESSGMGSSSEMPVSTCSVKSAGSTTAMQSCTVVRGSVCGSVRGQKFDCEADSTETDGVGGEADGRAAIVGDRIAELGTTATKRTAELLENSGATSKRSEAVEPTFEALPFEGAVRTGSHSSVRVPPTVDVEVEGVKDTAVTASASAAKASAAAATAALNAFPAAFNAVSCTGTESPWEQLLSEAYQAQRQQQSVDRNNYGGDLIRGQNPPTQWQVQTSLRCREDGGQEQRNRQEDVRVATGEQEPRSGLQQARRTRQEHRLQLQQQLMQLLGQQQSPQEVRGQPSQQEFKLGGDGVQQARMGRCLFDDVDISCTRGPVLDSAFTSATVVTSSGGTSKRTDGAVAAAAAEAASRATCAGSIPLVTNGAASTEAASPVAVGPVPPTNSIAAELSTMTQLEAVELTTGEVSETPRVLSTAVAVEKARIPTASVPVDIASTNSCDNDSESSDRRTSTGLSGIKWGAGVDTGSLEELARHVQLLLERERNEKTRDRLQTCLDALEHETLDLQTLRVVCSKGMPDCCPALRSFYWRLLLRCLPLTKAAWRQERIARRMTYEAYKEEFLREPETVRRLRHLQAAATAAADISGPSAGCKDVVASVVYSRDSGASAGAGAAAGAVISRSCGSQLTSETPVSTLPSTNELIPDDPIARQTTAALTSKSVKDDAADVTAHLCRVGEAGARVTAISSTCADPDCSSNSKARQKELKRQTVMLAAVKDHPLNQHHKSAWRNYWDDAEIFDQINKDVFRTRPELAFFSLNPHTHIQQQHQLRMYPPPPSRNAMNSSRDQCERADDVPLLIDVDEALRRQRIYFGAQVARNNNDKKASNSVGKHGAAASISGVNTPRNNNSSSSSTVNRIRNVFRASIRKTKMPGISSKGGNNSHSSCSSSKRSSSSRRSSSSAENLTNTSLQSKTGLNNIAGAAADSLSDTRSLAADVACTSGEDLLGLYVDDAGIRTSSDVAASDGVVIVRMCKGSTKSTGSKTSKTDRVAAAHCSSSHDAADTASTATATALSAAAEAGGSSGACVSERRKNSLLASWTSIGRPKERDACTPGEYLHSKDSGKKNKRMDLALRTCGSGVTDAADRLEVTAAAALAHKEERRQRKKLAAESNSRATSERRSKSEKSAKVSIRGSHNSNKSHSNTTETEGKRTSTRWTCENKDSVSRSSSASLESTVSRINSAEVLYRDPDSTKNGIAAATAAAAAAAAKAATTAVATAAATSPSPNSTETACSVASQPMDGIPDTTTKVSASEPIPSVSNICNLPSEMHTMSNISELTALSAVATTADEERRAVSFVIKSENESIPIIEVATSVSAPESSAAVEVAPSAAREKTTGGEAVQSLVVPAPLEPVQTISQPQRAPAGVQDICDMLTPSRHYDVLCRILFVYAKVNPGIRYVQGMNELLAPVYYALMMDPTYTDYQQAEAEIFFCFMEVMQQQQDVFCKALDPTEAGVQGRIAQLSELLKNKDREVWTHLETSGVDPQFYALRWLLLMLTQEFQMPDVLALWDAFIADTGRPIALLFYVCVAIIKWLRPALLAGDFTACMKLLQHLPAFDPKALLSAAITMRAEDLVVGRRITDIRNRGALRRGYLLQKLDPVQEQQQQQGQEQPQQQVLPKRRWGTLGPTASNMKQWTLTTQRSERFTGSSTSSSPAVTSPLSPPPGSGRQNRAGSLEKARSNINNSGGESNAIKLRSDMLHNRTSESDGNISSRKWVRESVETNGTQDFVDQRAEQDTTEERLQAEEQQEKQHQDGRSLVGGEEFQDLRDTRQRQWGQQHHQQRLGGQEQQYVPQQLRETREQREQQQNWIGFGADEGYLSNGLGIVDSVQQALGSADLGGAEQAFQNIRKLTAVGVAQARKSAVSAMSKYLHPSSLPGGLSSFFGQDQSQGIDTPPRKTVSDGVCVGTNINDVEDVSRLGVWSVRQSKSLGPTGFNSKATDLNGGTENGRICDGLKGREYVSSEGSDYTGPNNVYSRRHLDVQHPSSSTPYAHLYQQHHIMCSENVNKDTSEDTKYEDVRISAELDTMDVEKKKNDNNGNASLESECIFTRVHPTKYHLNKNTKKLPVNDRSILDTSHIYKQLRIHNERIKQSQSVVNDSGGLPSLASSSSFVTLSSSSSKPSLSSLSSSSSSSSLSSSSTSFYSPSAPSTCTSISSSTLTDSDVLNRRNDKKLSKDMKEESKKIGWGKKLGDECSVERRDGGKNDVSVEDSNVKKRTEIPLTFL